MLKLLVEQTPVCNLPLLSLFQGLAHSRLCGRVDRASATEAVDSGSIPDRAKPKTVKTGIHNFAA